MPRIVHFRSPTINSCTTVASRQWRIQQICVTDLLVCCLIGNMPLVDHLLVSHANHRFESLVRSIIANFSISLVISIIVIVMYLVCTRVYMNLEKILYGGNMS